MENLTLKLTIYSALAHQSETPGNCYQVEVAGVGVVDFDKGKCRKVLFSPKKYPSDTIGRYEDQRWDEEDGKYGFFVGRPQHYNKHGEKRREARIPCVFGWYLRAPPGKRIIIESCLGKYITVKFARKLRTSRTFRIFESKYSFKLI